MQPDCKEAVGRLEVRLRENFFDILLPPPYIFRFVVYPAQD